MSATSAGFGLRPIYDQSGRVRARAYVNGIVSGYSGGTIYQYMPVKLVTTSGANRLEVPATTDDIVGVFDGVEYTDSNGRRQYSKYWPSGLTPLSGTSWTVYVWDDPRTIFEVQVNAAISNWGTYGGIGQQIDLASGTGTGGIGGGSSVTQLSNAQADAARISTSAQRVLRIIDKARYVDNDWGDAYPIVQVQIAQHQYIGNKVAV